MAIEIYLPLHYRVIRNPGAKTIEGDLFKAMVEAGAVSKDNADDIKKVRVDNHHLAASELEGCRVDITAVG